MAAFDLIGKDLFDRALFALLEHARSARKSSNEEPIRPVLTFSPGPF